MDMCHIFLPCCLSVDGHLGWFYFSTIGKITEINTYVYMFCGRKESPLCIILHCGSYNSSIYKILRNHYTDFHNNCNQFTLPLAVSICLSPHPHIHVMKLHFLMRANMIGWNPRKSHFNMHLPVDWGYWNL